MTDSDPNRLAELVEEVLDAEASSSDDDANVVSAIVRKHVQHALHAGKTPDVDAVLSAIIDDEGAAV